jgi:hypothetical protein
LTQDHSPVVAITDVGLVTALDMHAGILPYGSRKDRRGLRLFLYHDTPQLQAAWAEYRANRIFVSAQQFMALYRGWMIRAKSLIGRDSVDATVDMLNGLDGKAESGQ